MYTKVKYIIALLLWLAMACTKPIDGNTKPQGDDVKKDTTDTKCKGCE